MVDCGCPLGPHDPGCYCGCRSACEGFVDSLLLPTLQSAPGQACIKNVLGPLWRTCDTICGRDNKDPNRESAAGAAKAVVTLTFRPVKSEGKYRKAFAQYATTVQASTPGVRAFFSFMDKSREKTALQVMWCDSPDCLAGIPTDAAVEACYAGTDGAFGAVWGLRDEAVRAALDATGVAYEYGSMPRGFIKSAPHPGFDPKLYPGPPMIWMSKRFVQPGRNPVIAAAFGKVGDLQYHTAPAFLSAFEYTAPDDEDLLWSLRFFNDYEMGHVAHFPKTLLSFIPTRVLFTMIPELRGGLGAEFPVGLSFSTKADIDKAIAYNGGNKAYDQHYWEDVIGPMPDMGKGMDAPAAAEMSRDEPSAPLLRKSSRKKSPRRTA